MRLACDCHFFYLYTVRSHDDNILHHYRLKLMRRHLARMRRLKKIERAQKRRSML